MSALYISERSAHRAGQQALSQRKAKSYRVKFMRRINPDRSVDAGYSVLLSKGVTHA